MSEDAPPRVLVVDDEDVLSRVTARRLRSRGYEASTAASGVETLATLGQERVDLVLLDLMMPVMGGIEVLKAIRTRWSAADLPVLVLTARTDQETLDEALAAGANGVVVKPPAFEALVAEIRRQLTPVDG